MEEKSTFEEFEKIYQPNARRKLLPVWIKIFIWIFIVMGTIAVFLPLKGLMFSDHTNLSIYGIESTQMYSPAGIFVISLIVFKGIVAYGLWFEQEWAVKAAIADAGLGIAICVIMMFFIPFTVDHISFTIRLELIPLYFYFKKMRQIQNIWEAI
ncbi:MULTISPECIES: hypothetical protein [Chryseobacterium]|uniref:Magnesium-transporting ATPase (P-type) n=1 Tax=Chryseobacterium camelliae TaxID=1265445 RepID=A0ABU0TH71_9FLAO|nr:MULTISPECIES: hypothetical protein [Chryseobacterium]MDT3405795.1 magnesium-transporting ATPase (P-type) [Pseudacidovorax intermedius]MDQ1096398.1 magnesium-transporting ATPase (P-type) [Chryseobacterium camelliae]MDQ1100338.1 magnesium-transporting ATPase (P-type) [Chryseobacterium sp. SORGH_AS_1048]MDR6087680.1 magnesium-transporting ATPase (P-type) [Chryseobacterium sp. SORGH_AS_0909]MDR6132055.1 magnesium-transporting ATPase (P-type) [Chryseobacterium sp. SORGH_AS_1175]